MPGTALRTLKAIIHLILTTVLGAEPASWAVTLASCSEGPHAWFNARLPPSRNWAQHSYNIRI